MAWAEGLMMSFCGGLGGLALMLIGVGCGN